jgi:hypothetical protein
MPDQRPHKSDSEFSQSYQARYLRERRLNDPEFRIREREKMRRYMKRKLADPEFKAKHSARNAKRLKERRSAPETWSRWSLNQIRDRAKRRGIPFNLEPEDLSPPVLCPVLHVPIVYGGTSGEMFAPTVDRLKPELGYTKGNVCVISRRANSIKNDATSAEVQAVADWMKLQGL